MTDAQLTTDLSADVPPPDDPPPTVKLLFCGCGRPLGYEHLCKGAKFFTLLGNDEPINGIGFNCKTCKQPHYWTNGKNHQRQKRTDLHEVRG